LLERFASVTPVLKSVEIIKIKGNIMEQKLILLLHYIITVTFKKSNVDIRVKASKNSFKKT